MKTMGCETNGLVPWCVLLIEEYGARLHQGTALKKCIETLKAHVEMLRECPINPSAEYVQTSWDQAHEHLTATKEADAEFLYKHHVWTHMVRRIRRHGPPYAAATFLDEWQPKNG